MKSAELAFGVIDLGHRYRAIAAVATSDRSRNGSWLSSESVNLHQSRDEIHARWFAGSPAARTPRSIALRPGTLLTIHWTWL